NANRPGARWWADKISCEHSIMQTTDSEADRTEAGATRDTVAASAPGARKAGTGIGQATLWGVPNITILSGAYAWYDQRRITQSLRSDVAQRLGATENAATQARTRESDLSNQLRDAQAKLALLETRVTEFQSQQAALEALYRELAPSRDEV